MKIKLLIPVMLLAGLFFSFGSQHNHSQSSTQPPAKFNAVAVKGYAITIANKEGTMARYEERRAHDPTGGNLLITTPMPGYSGSFSGIISSVAPLAEVTASGPEDEAGNLVYLTCAPETKTGSLSALLSVWIKIKNKESKAVKLKKLEYQYSTSGTNKIFSFYPAKDNNDPVVIEAGKTLKFQNSRGYYELGKVIEINYPFPSQLTIKLFFDGYTDPVVFTKKLKAWSSSNSYALPFKESDLGVNEYWYADASHGGGSQVFAYDMVMKGWDEKTGKWSTLFPGTSGDKNEHFRCFGRPVYAVADGEVVKCNDIIKDNEPGIDTDGGGNTVHLKVGNEIVRYYHLKQNSLNKALVKPGARVKKGDFLGRVGSTATAGTHLHIDVIPADEEDPETTLPLMFSTGYIIHSAKMPEPDPGAAWVKLTKSGLPFIPDADKPGDRSCLIWPGDKPTWYPGGKAEIAKHGLAEKDYQDAYTKIRTSGYYPVWVDAYEVNNKTFFNVVFRPDKDLFEIHAKHDMSITSFQQEYNEWVKQKGYRLLQLESYTDNGQLKFAAIFQKKNGAAPAQPAYHGLSQAEHQTLFEKYTGEGYVPVNVAVAVVGGKKYYSAFYEKRNTGGFVLKSTLTQQEYQSLFDENKAKGYGQVYINAYSDDGKTYFSVIWYKNSGFSGGAATRKSDGESYQEKWEDNTSRGFLTRCVTGYEEGGKHWFAAHWSK